MAWLTLESDRAAMAKALGALPKYPAPHAFMLPKAKPKPRPQPTREDPAIVAAVPPKKRKADTAKEVVCTCKAKRWTDTLTDLDKLMLRAD